jgi:hypothetical protein
LDKVRSTPVKVAITFPLLTSKEFSFLVKAKRISPLLLLSTIAVTTKSSFVAISKFSFSVHWRRTPKKKKKRPKEEVFHARR